MGAAGHHVLIVEDDGSVRQVLGYMLSHAGWEISAVTSGADALTRLSETKFDAILCDVDMGRGLNGLEVLRQRPALNAETPFVMLTGHSTDGRREAALASGATAFLEKPILPAQLLEALPPASASAGSPGDVPIGILRADDAHVRRALEIIDHRFRDPDFSVNALAREAGVSPEHLVRVFTKHVGVNLLDHIQRKRMAAAEQLLADPVLFPIYNIAVDCGYRDLREFDRWFKRVHGCTPTAWRKR